MEYKINSCEIFTGVWLGVKRWARSPGTLRKTELQIRLVSYDHIWAVEHIMQERDARRKVKG